MAVIERLFSLKHNRWFGMHNPFGSSYGKAGDPHINLRRLAILSFSGDLAIRHEVAHNLAQRFGTYLSAGQLKRIATEFNRAEIVEALKQTSKVNTFAKLFVADFIRGLNSLELGVLLSDNISKTDNQIIMDAAAHPLTPTEALIPLLKHPYSVATEGFGKIVGYERPGGSVHIDGTWVIGETSKCQLIEEGGQDVYTEPSGPIYEQYKFRFPIRDIAASNLRQRLHQLDPDATRKVQITLGMAVTEEIR